MDKQSKKSRQEEQEAHNYCVRQNSEYSETGKAAPDNNIFFETKSNPLSSKGN